MKTAELSPTMKAAIDHAGKHGGELVRYPGGYWGRLTPTGARPTDEWFGTPTVNGIVARGYGEWADWRGSGASRFPVRMRLATPNAGVTGAELAKRPR